MTCFSDWLPRIVWVLVEIYLLNSSKATWLVSCCTGKCCLLYWKMCSFWKMWTVPGWFPWNLRMKKKDFFFLSKWRKIEVCSPKIYINAGHILGDGPFFPHFHHALSDTRFKMSWFIKKTEENIIKFKILACLNKRLFFIVLFRQPPYPELDKGGNTVTLWKENSIVWENNTEQKGLCFPVDRAFLTEDGRSYRRQFQSKKDRLAWLVSPLAQEVITHSLCGLHAGTFLLLTVSLSHPSPSPPFGNPGGNYFGWDMSTGGTILL